MNDRPEVGAAETVSSQIISARSLRERLLADRHRPGYHFVPPEDVGLPGDPNGAFFANGLYHLMYLYSRRGRFGMSGRGFSWGHISSVDLVHWRHHPDAIVPSDGDGGCFSGGAFVDEDGTAYLSFWRLPRDSRDRTEGEGIGIARSIPPYDEWEKLPTPSLDATEWGVRRVSGTDGEPLYLGNSDPSNIWKKDGLYYMEAGNLQVLNKLGRREDSPRRFRGDWVELLRSADLVEWQHVHRFYERKHGNEWTQESEDDMCPSFLPLPRSRDGGEPSGKHLQLFISHNMGCQYYIGTYDRDDDSFLPESHGRMSWTDAMYFAPEALVDGGGRQIMWAWLRDVGSTPTDFVACVAAGWYGIYGLPRVLWLGEDETLRLAPVPELAGLRYNPVDWPDVSLDAGAQQPLQGINGQSCEIELTVEAGAAGRVGLRVLGSADGAEATVLYYDRRTARLCCDTTSSGGSFPVVEEAPLNLPADKELHLRVFVDRGVVEVFANDRQAIARRVMPSHGSTRIHLFADEAPARIHGIRGWEMMPSNPY